MKLPTDNLRLGQSLPDLLKALTQLLPLFARQVNAVSEGRVSGYYNSVTAAPTTGKWQHGDYLKNTAPAELGAVGSKYVVKGWICVASGEPGTWVEDRGVTGA